MSRIDDYSPDDTKSFLASCAFTHNIKLAVAGKKGQAFLKELETVLLAMPEKRLASGFMADTDNNDVPLGVVPEPNGDVCALGAVALARMMKLGVPRDVALKDLLKRFDPSEGNWMLTKLAAAEVRISHPLAYAVIYQNDECYAKTPEERYTKVLAWVQRKLAGEPDLI